MVKEIDKSQVEAAELKAKEVTDMDAALKVEIYQIGRFFPKSFFPGSNHDGDPVLWINPEEQGQEDKPNVVITHKGISKTDGLVGKFPNRDKLNQLSYYEYLTFFEKGLNLLRSFSQIETIRTKYQPSAEDLKNLVHLIYKSAGGDDEYKSSLMEIPGVDKRNIQITLSKPDSNFATVVFYNGLPVFAGEEVKLIESNGTLSWKITSINSFHSTILNRDIELEVPQREIIYSREALNTVDLGKVCKEVSERYIRSRCSGKLPFFRS